MQRLIFSLVVVVGATAAIAAGATGAFFSDTETSLGNLFTAGQIDLKVDNESYYNGNRCELDDWDSEENTPDTYAWSGDAPFPAEGTPCDTSWLPDDLNDGSETLHKFFNFLDVKPDDEGEDTISLEVQNDAWMCMAVSLTSNDDTTTTEPEGLVDPTAEPDTEWDGELAQNIQMFWWADDGDNVYECMYEGTIGPDGEPGNPACNPNDPDSEPALSDGVQTLYDLATTSPFEVALADSQNNAWGETPGTPVPAGTSYIAKAWCFGTLTTPGVAPGTGENPSVASGILCNGENLDNTTQTDKATLDVSFSAVQARHNEDFLCYPPETGTITVRKAVEAGNDPTPATAATFEPYQIDGNTIALNTAIPVAPGSHTVTENAAADPDYTQTFGADCAPNGVINNVVAGQNYECSITNTYAPQCQFEVGANLVTNGGFETPEVTDAANDWQIFNSVAGGWTVEWRGDIPPTFDPPGATPVQPRPAIAKLELHEGVVGPAFEGDTYAELDSDWTGATSTPNYSGEPASISISQMIATQAGATYDIKFVWAARPGTTAANNRLETRWGGAVVDDTGNQADPPATGIQWIERTVQVTATGASTELRFTDLGTADSLGTFLDDVQVYQISCPNTAPAVDLLSIDGFGVGGSVNDIPDWDEEGSDADATTNAQAAGAGDDSASPNGDRFARIGQDEWICRAVTTTGHHGLQLKYYWRGDGDAENDEDYGYVEYAGGTCAAPTGLTTVAIHELDDGADGGSAWSGLQSVGIGDGATLIRFRQDSTAATENWRIDGVSVTGIPN